MNFIYLFLFFISSIIIIYSYGFVLEKLIIKNKNNLNLYKNNNNFGEKGIYAISLLLFVSLLIHFFLPINYYITIPVFLVGFIIFFWNIKSILNESNINKLELLIILLIMLPFIFINKFHDDYNYYHLPYLNAVFSYKIIFGLGNLNNILVYPQNAWLDFVSLFKIPYLESNVSYIINSSIFFYFIVFNYEKLKQNKILILKIFNSLIIIFSLALFSRLKDFGLEIIPQLILFLITYYILEIYFDSEVDIQNNIEKILIFSMTAIFLRIGSISILPVVLIVLIHFRKQTLNIFLNYKLTAYCLSASLIFFLKNIIISGCLIYPLSFSCIKQETLSWSIGKEIPKINKNVLHAFSRGWMFYAKEITGAKDKFVFNAENEILSHKDYMNQNINFWFKYWFQDPDTIRILNLILISFFVILIFLIFNFNKISFMMFSKNSKILLFLLLIFFTQVFFWFFVGTPSLRLGGYSALIPIFIFLILIVLSVTFPKGLKINQSVYFLITISLLYFSYKNIDRIINEYNYNDFNINQPWPIHQNLSLNKDYIIEKKDQTNINLRLPTNKLLMGNLDSKKNYILHCGNIDMLCTPIKKFKCIKKIKYIKSYLVIENDFKECLKVYEFNVLY